MNCHKNVIQAKGTVQAQDKKHPKWVTYDNVVNMYKIVESRIAIRAEEQYMYDQEGIQVDSAEHIFGLPSKFKLIKPEFCYLLMNMDAIQTKKEITEWEVNCMLCLRMGQLKVSVAPPPTFTLLLLDLLLAQVNL